jgi:hypothetical protein
MGREVRFAWRLTCVYSSSGLTLSPTHELGYLKRLCFDWIVAHPESGSRQLLSGNLRMARIPAGAANSGDDTSQEPDFSPI